MPSPKYTRERRERERQEEAKVVGPSQAKVIVPSQKKKRK